VIPLCCSDDQLIHDAGLDADPLVLNTLADAGGFDWIPGRIEEGVESAERGHFDGG
jgi:hypothetical protein